MLTAAGLWRSGILSDYDAKLLPGCLPLGRELKTGQECRAIFDDHGIRCRPNLACCAYRESVVALGDGGECELAGYGSCGGILAVAVHREELDDGHVDGISRRVAQDAVPGKRRRSMEDRNENERQDEKGGSNEQTGPGEHREALYPC